MGSLRSIQTAAVVERHVFPREEPPIYRSVSELEWERRDDDGLDLFFDLPHQRIIPGTVSVRLSWQGNSGRWPVRTELCEIQKENRWILVIDRRYTLPGLKVGSVDHTMGHLHLSFPGSVYVPLSDTIVIDYKYLRRRP